MRHLLHALLCLAALFGSAAAAPAAQQDGGEFGRLSQDQAKLAEQVRRLERLLQTLEDREREKDGNRAELLRRARERLTGLDGHADLATAIEEVARSLSEMRSGTALEAQAELVEELQSLLEFLLQAHLEQQLDSLLQAAKARAQELGELADAQRQLLRRLEELRRRTGADSEPQAGEAGAEPRDPSAEEAQPGEGERKPAEGEPSEGREGAEAERQEDGSAETGGETPPPTGETEAGETPPPAGQQQPGEQQPGEPGPLDAEALAEMQEELRERIEEMLEQGQAGRTQPQLDRARQRSRQAEQRLREEQLREAQQRMEETLRELEEAQQQAEDQAEEAQQRERLEELIDLLATSQALLDRHLEVSGPLTAFIEESDGRRPSRRDHVSLRGWSEAERDISSDTADLLVEVDLGGAEMFPFLLQLLADDHARLARDLGPGRYRATAAQAELAEAVAGRWAELIEAVRTEMERVRQQVEQPGGGGQESQGGQEEQEDENQALVGFAEELQLLKRVQQELATELEGYVRRREALAEAGLGLDQDDLEEIDRLIERQGQLRQVYEAMLARLREQQQAGAEEDA
jgi:hypothetical protein